MSTMLPDDSDDDFDALIRAALPEVAPAAHFADAVLAPRPRSRTARTTLLAFIGGAVAAALVVTLAPRWWTSTPAAVGNVVAVDRQQVWLAGAVVSLAPGAAIDWDGPRVRLVRGEAFFRVEPRAHDDAVVIATAVGDVVVTGACFTVAVGAPMLNASSKSTALTFVAGGLVGAVIATVAVHEGSVRLDNDHGSAVVAVGERAQMDAAHAPVLAGADLVRAEQRLATVLATIAASEGAAAGDTKALAAENTRLRAVLKKQDEELSLLDGERVNRDGEALPFPADLPPRLTEKALLTALTTALKDAGVEGDVSAIDCAEFPCIVWGEVKGDTSTLAETLKKSKAFEPYADDGKHVRGWGSGDGDTELFAIALTPEDPSRTPAQKDAFERRLRFRAESGFEANKPASWTDNKAP